MIKKNSALRPKSSNGRFLKRQRNRSKSLLRETLTPVSSTTLDTNYDKFDCYSEDSTSNLKNIDVKNFDISNEISTYNLIKEKVINFIKFRFVLK